MLITNYLITAWRNILKHKLFSSINILGLAIGLASVMLIALFVRDELSYDNHWTNADRLYRTHITFQVPGRDPVQSVMTPGPAMHAFKKDFPQIEYAFRIGMREPTIIKDNNYFLEDISLVDPDIIEMLDFNVVSGDLEAALADKSSLVLNQSVARKYFGAQNPIDQTITIDFNTYQRDYKVAAIIEDLPQNSQLDITAMVVIDEEAWAEDSWFFAQWFSVNAQLYYQLVPGADNQAIKDALPEFINRNFPTIPFGGDDVQTSDMIIMDSVNIKDLHLNPAGFGEYRDSGDINMVMVFSAVAALILIIASINFMNLSTARASQRAKEVSLRKVMGASQRNLVVQFLGESVLLTFISLLFAVILVEFSLPLYNDLIGKELEFSLVSSDGLTIVALAFAVGVLGGSYPAFVLSSFRPAENLKANQSSETKASIAFRTALVVFQFAVSIGLFVSTAVVYGQMLYTQNKDLGYTKENLLVINDIGRDAARTKLELLVNELRRMPDVNSVTWSNFTPGRTNENNTIVRTPDMATEDAMLIGNRGVGYEYFKTHDIPIIAGREYDITRANEELMSDHVREGNGTTYSIVINELAMGRLGFSSPDDALGKIIYRGVGAPQENLEAPMQIIGVVPDVHFDSLKRTIRPEIYDLQAQYANTITVRFNNDPTAVVNVAQALWEREVPTIPFDYDFVEDNLAEQYESEQGQATMFASFSGLAIFIASLGLYGLASFTAEQRTKEIGIRKVMGASVFDVVKLLIWQFSKPVMIANFIAWPISYFAMNSWLENFVYRIEGFFILGTCLMAGITALLIAWGTVANNSMRVAKANPITALRYE